MKISLSLTSGLGKLVSTEFGNSGISTVSQQPRLNMCPTADGILNDRHQNE